MLAVHDPRIIGLRIEAVDVLEMTVDVCFFLASVRPSKVLSLVDEAVRGVAAEEVGEVEAVAHKGNAEDGEREGAGGVV